jgi:predicted hydrocarbon binding protein
MGLSSFIQKLLFVKQFSIDKGKIEIFGSRYIMLDASDILVLQDIDQSKVYNSAKESSKTNIENLVKHAQVYKGIKSQSLKNIANLIKKIGKNDQGVIKTLQQIFEVYGLGKLNTVELNNDHKTAHLQIKDSTIAQSQLKKGPSKQPVCSLTAGILAGIFSYIFNKDVNCKETKCIATKQDICEFQIS